MSRTELLAKRIAEELATKPYLNAIADLRSVQVEVKFVKETGLPRVVIIRTESES